MAPDEKRTYYIITVMLLVILVSLCAMTKDRNTGEELYQRYCFRCHGNEDKRSGNLVYFSKMTIRERYYNRSKKLFMKLQNIDKYSISNIMIKAVHEISDTKTLVLIVNYLADPDLDYPRGEDKRVKGL